MTAFLANLPNHANEIGEPHVFECLVNKQLQLKKQKRQCIAKYLVLGVK
jgi:hypothetical protein